MREIASEREIGTDVVKSKRDNYYAGDRDFLQIHCQLMN